VAQVVLVAVVAEAAARREQGSVFKYVFKAPWGDVMIF
jgi:hypothetical protein